MEDNYKVVLELQYLDIGALVTYQRAREMDTMQLRHRINLNGANGHWFPIVKIATHGPYQFDAYTTDPEAKVVKVTPLTRLGDAPVTERDPSPLVEVGGMGAFATVATEGPDPAVVASPIFDEADAMDAFFGYDKGTDEGSGLTIFVLTGDDGSGISIENASVEDLHNLLSGALGD